MLQLSRVSDCEQQQLYASVPQFYDFLQNRVLVSFRPKFEEPSATNPEFDLMLSKKMTYELVGRMWRLRIRRLTLLSSDGNKSR